MKRLSRAFSLFAIMTALSRITGLLREMSFAYFIGANAFMDAFYLAYRIPNFLRNIFAEGAFSQAFIPTLARYREEKPLVVAQQFLNHVAGMLLLGLTAVTLLASIFAPWIINLLAPGFKAYPEQWALAVKLLRLTFPFIIFVSLAAYISGILNSYQKFGVAAFAPNLLNLFLIAAVILGAKFSTHPTYFLAIGLVIGGCAQFLVQLPVLSSLKLTFRPIIDFHDSGVREVLCLMIPALFGASLAQMSFLVNNFLASYLPSGSISWLNYANLLVMLPLGIFGVAAATVILPELSGASVRENADYFSKILAGATKLILLISFPAMIGLTVLSDQIVLTLFKWGQGRFTFTDVSMIGSAVRGFALGLPAFMIIKVFTSAFYARREIKIPVKIAAVALLVNINVAILLIGPFKHVGLALATTISASLNAIILFCVSYRRGIWRPCSEIKFKFLMQLLLANFGLFLSLKLFVPDLAVWENWSWYRRVFSLLFCCVSATAEYLLLLILLGFRIDNLSSE